MALNFGLKTHASIVSFDRDSAPRIMLNGEVSAIPNWLKFSKIIIASILILSAVTTGCRSGSGEITVTRQRKAIEEFNVRLKERRFEDTYRELAALARSMTSEGEFGQRLRFILAELSKIDSDLNLEDESRELYNSYADLVFIHRAVTGKSGRIDLEITLDADKIFDLCIVPAEGKDYKYRCMTNALRKI